MATPRQIKAKMTELAQRTKQTQDQSQALNSAAMSFAEKAKALSAMNNGSTSTTTPSKSTTPPPQRAADPQKKNHKSSPQQNTTSRKNKEYPASQSAASGHNADLSAITRSTAAFRQSQSGGPGAIAHSTRAFKQEQTNTSHRTAESTPSAAQNAGKSASQKSETEILAQIIIDNIAKLKKAITEINDYKPSDTSTPLGQAKQIAMRNLYDTIHRITLPLSKLSNTIEHMDEQTAINALNALDLRKIINEVNTAFTTTENAIKDNIKSKTPSSLDPLNVFAGKGNEGFTGDAFVRARANIIDLLTTIETAITKPPLHDAKHAKDGQPTSPRSPKSGGTSPHSTASSGGSGPTLFAGSSSHDAENAITTVETLKKQTDAMLNAYTSLEGTTGDNYQRMFDCVAKVKDIIGSKTITPDPTDRYLKAVSWLIKAYEYNMLKRSKTSFREAAITETEYNTYAKGLNNILSVKHHYSRLLGLVLKNAAAQNPNLGQLLLGRGLMSESQQNLLNSLTLIENVNRSEYAFLQSEDDQKQSLKAKK